MFFFKRKKIIIDCLTDEPGAFNYHPIDRASNFLPEWWKSLPPRFESNENPPMKIERSTMKRCDGFVQLYRQGAILPMWTSLQIQTLDTTYNYSFAKHPINRNLPLTEYHNDIQYGDTFKDFLHMKIISPWFLKQKQECNFMMQPVIWNTSNHWQDFTILPGVVDFKFQHWTHVNMFLQKNREKILIEAGTPMYQIIPLTEDEVIFKNHLVESSEIDKLYHSRFGTFIDSYKNIKKQFKEKSNKCPFSGK